MKLPFIVNEVNFPPEPVDLPAEACRAFMSEDTIPLELHGDLGCGSANYSRVVGYVTGRRVNGGMIDITVHYRSPVHQKMVDELCKDNQMVFMCMGGGWPYKAMVGVKGWNKEIGDLGARAIAPLVVSILESNHEKTIISAFKRFADSVPSKKGIHLIRLTSANKSNAFFINATFGTRTLIELDRLHLACVEKISLFKTRARGDVTIHRDHVNRTITLNVQGSEAFAEHFIKAISEE